MDIVQHESHFLLRFAYPQQLKQHSISNKQAVIIVIPPLLLVPSHAAGMSLIDE